MVVARAIGHRGQHRGGSGMAAVIMAGASIALVAAAAPKQTTALDRTVALHGIAPAMSRREAIAQTHGCSDQPGAAARQLRLRCETGTLTLSLTDDDRVWSVRASLDLSASGSGLADARRRLTARFGRPTAVLAAPETWLWLPRPASAQEAIACRVHAGLLASARETPAAPRPQVSAACLPLLSAILPEQDGHVGLIVEQQDPTLGLARQR